MLVVESFPCGPLQCNCSLIGCKETGEAIVIDPGGDVDDIIELAEKHGLKVKYLLHTHAHFDHVLGSREMKERTGAQICLHKGDQWLYDNLLKQCSMFGFTATDPLPVDQYLDDEQILEFGKQKASVIHTPGHTPGSLCYSVQDKESILFAGDTLFKQGIGRTDLWGGSYEEIIESISGRLYTLDDSTRVITGHGPDTSIWHEKRQNPFVSAAR